MNLGGEKRDDHAGARARDDTTLTSLVTCKKTTHLDEDSHAQREMTTTPKERSQVASS
jgi:hypothetical protein